MKAIQMSKVINNFMKRTSTSLKELSIKSKIPYSTLYSWCENRPPKDITKAKALADYMEISLDELIFGTPFNENDHVFYEGYIKISIEKDKDD